MKYSQWDFKMDEKRSYFFKRHSIIRKYDPALGICS
jgi:hypothetical protein